MCFYRNVARMSAGFAGSRSLDERRRRRLAQEFVEQVAPSAARTNIVSDSSAPTPVQVIRRRTQHESIIPQSPWKILFFSSLVITTWLGMLWLGVSPWATSVGLGDVFSLQSGRTVHLFSTACLLMSAQLSFFILWHRARSRKDFGGRYRIWAWAGVFWSLTCFATATEIYLPLAGMAYERWPIECWRSETLFWIGPFSICYVAIHRLLAMEMRTSKAAQYLWTISFWIGVISLCLQLGLEVFIAEQQRLLFSMACLTAWHAMLTISLLTHARYVAHVTNEASEKVMTVRKKVIRWGQERLAELRLFLQAEESGVMDVPETSKNKKREATPPKTAKPEPASKQLTASKPTDVVKPQPVQKSPEPAKPKPVPPEPVKREPVKPEVAKPELAKPIESKTRVLGQNLRMDTSQSASTPHVQSASQSSASQDDDDVDDDENDQSSLSKKERRRLRKTEKQRNR